MAFDWTHRLWYQQKKWGIFFLLLFKDYTLFCFAVLSVLQPTRTTGLDHSFPAEKSDRLEPQQRDFN